LLQLSFINSTKEKPHAIKKQMLQFHLDFPKLFAVINNRMVGRTYDEHTNREAPNVLANSLEKLKCELHWARDRRQVAASAAVSSHKVADTQKPAENSLAGKTKSKRNKQNHGNNSWK